MAALANPSPAAQAALYLETDVRFWAQTGYKIGRKLDPTIPADAAWIPTWSTIYAKVLAEWRAHGWAVPTHKSSAVTVPLAAGARAQAEAEQHVANAVHAPDAATRDAQLAAAHDRHAEASSHAAQGAQAQPLSIDPAQADRAARDAVAASGANAPGLLANVTEAGRALATHAIANALGAAHALATAARVVGQATPTDPVAVAPTREGAAAPDGSGIAHGAEPEHDANGRVKQPSGSVGSASTRWGLIAVGAACVGAIVVAGQIKTYRSSPRGRRRKAKGVPVAYIGG